MKNSKRLYALLCAAALPIGGTLTACGKPSADPSTDGGTRYLPGEPEKGAVYAKATKPDLIAYTVTEFQGDAAAEITFTQPTDQNGTSGHGRRPRGRFFIMIVVSRKDRIARNSCARFADTRNKFVIAGRSWYR